MTSSVRPGNRIVCNGRSECDCARTALTAAACLCSSAQVVWQGPDGHNNARQTADIAAFRSGELIFIILLSRIVGFPWLSASFVLLFRDASAPVLLGGVAYVLFPPGL